MLEQRWFEAVVLVACAAACSDVDHAPPAPVGGGSGVPRPVIVEVGGNSNAGTADAGGSVAAGGGGDVATSGSFSQAGSVGTSFAGSGGVSGSF